MTDRIAIWLGGLVLLAIGVDILLYGTEHLLFLARKMYDLVDWLAFWR
ncbi:MAG: hypothetical protein OIF47_03820 [Marinibacterium sp.]|nr:hypothetical protein [Marinibacterium sp.]